VPDLVAGRAPAIPRLVQRFDGDVEADLVAELEQSATVLATRVARTVTPSMTWASTPSVSAGPEKRRRRRDG